MSWVSLTVDVAVDSSEVVQALMLDEGASGLEVRDHLNRIMPSVRAPEPGFSIVIGWFEGAEVAEAALERIHGELPAVPGLIEPVVERDWSVEWRSQIRSVTVGRLWVGPPWEKATAPKDKVCLFIEPKMAFGTGDHPTTSLCLAAVDDFMKEHPQASVLDVGTGTGVLAFAAKKLGAGRTVGVDNDEVAVGLARECADENALVGVELSADPLTKVAGTFDLVLANILANTLVELAPLIAPRVGQRLIMAGVLVPQAEEVKAAYVAQGLKVRGEVVQGEWIRLDLER